MQVLITGTGFVGSNAASKFMEEGYTVAALDLNPVSVDYLGKAQDKLRMIKGDTTSFSSLEEVISNEKPEILVHTATYLNPKEAFNVFKVNVGGTANVLELARKYDLRLVYLSSGAIYGQMEGQGDIYEDEKFGPVYPAREIDNDSGTAYSISKRLGEEWASMYRALYGLKVVALRLGWVYGRGIADYRLNSGISLFLRKALVNQPMNLPYGGGTFCDFVHVFDVNDAIYKAATIPVIKSLSYNIVYERGYWMKEVVDVVKKIIPGADLSLGPGLWPSKGVPVPRGGISFPSERHMDIGRAKLELGYSPSFDLERGTRDYLEWMKKNWDLCSPEVVPFRY